MKPIRNLLLGACLLASVGCSTVKDLQIDEGGLRAPTVQVSKSITETFSIDLEQASVKGEAPQTLEDSTTRFDLDDLKIYGPAELNTEFSLRASKAGLGINFLDREAIRLKVDFGLSEVDLDLRFEDQETGERYAFGREERGAYGRFNVILPLTKHLAASGHIGFTKFFDQDVGNMSEAALKLSLALGESLELYGGWFNWVYQDEDSWSDIEVDVSGAAYGLLFKF